METSRLAHGVITIESNIVSSLPSASRRRGVQIGYDLRRVARLLRGHPNGRRMSSEKAPPQKAGMGCVVHVVARRNRHWIDAWDLTKSGNAPKSSGTTKMLFKLLEELGKSDTEIETGPDAEESS